MLMLDIPELGSHWLATNGVNNTTPTSTEVGEIIRSHWLATNGVNNTVFI